MKAETEIWQVQTHEGVYQADLPTLKQWVAEGLVRPTDRVRKGSFNWIDAGRAPVLRRVFSGEEAVEVVAAPLEEGAAAGPQRQPAAEAHDSPDLGLAGDDAPRDHAHGAQPDPPAATAEEEPFLTVVPSLGTACHFHPLEAATLVCRSCEATFCRGCANRVGTSSVLLCALCGGFCDPLEALTERLALYARQGEGFGLPDFRQALAYPFRHLASLLGGALLYGFLLLAGMRAHLLATALVYGCISLVIRRVAYGNLKRDFLPDFSEFSFWDDVVVPCSLGVGVTLVTLGPTLLLVGMLLFGWLSAPSPAPQALDRNHPALAAAEGRPLEEDEVAVTPDDMSVLIDGGNKEQEEALERKVNGMKPGAQVARQIEETKRGEGNAVVYVCRLLLEHPGLVVLLALVALGWAVFYHPMALLVAGWTESFTSVLNPLVGLDTIRRMGLTYFKAFLMYLGVQAASLLLTFVVGFVTAPFDLPLIGNLPGTFLGGVVTFYTSLVVACLLGLALFKSADRLGIDLD